MTRPVIAIIGSGAIGSYYGGRLAQHGQDVHFLVRSDYSVVSKQGWQIRSCAGDFSVSPDRAGIHDDPRKMPKADLVIVALKATANDQYEALIGPLLKDDTAILTLQNGLGCERRLGEFFGAERVLGGLAFICVTRLAAGLIEHSDYGLIKLGEFVEPSDSKRARNLAELFRGCGIPCQAIESLKSARWEKLTWNVPFSGLGAVLDMDTRRLLAEDAGVKLIAQIIDEVLAIARADGVDLPREVGQEKIRQTQTMGAYRSSMQIDRQLGRPMEVEAILGEPLRVAERLGVAAPRISMLYRMARLVNLGNP